MPYAIIANWDGTFKVTRYNFVDTETEAQRLVDRLIGLPPPSTRIAEMQALLDEPSTSLGKRVWAQKEMVSLPLEKQAPNAFFTLMPTPDPGTVNLQHKARFWVANPGAGTMIFDTPACHAHFLAMKEQVIDDEADRRADFAFSPDNPERAGYIRAELRPGSKRTALDLRVDTLRTSAQTLKDSLVTKTPEEIIATDVRDDANWTE